MGHCSYNTRLIEQSSLEGKRSPLIMPYVVPASSQYRPWYGVEKE